MRANENSKVTDWAAKQIYLAIKLYKAKGKNNSLWVLDHEQPLLHSRCCAIFTFSFDTSDTGVQVS